MKPKGKKGSIREGRLCVGLWMVVVLALTGMLAAGAWAQGDYSLEYGIVSMDGGVRQTTDYEVTGFAVREGPEGGVTLSSSYAITSVLATDAAPVSGVGLWMLY